ncbi:hypothetical protein CHARACLAT_005103 [Characodon lateralis]|uniref:Uncharacterized protein n=1 Tax=Characodon lateralis TaxID=208331 RepID=A0ABU7D4A9_9TELE|nr:hypothetical protein [Characodon lateralis]
MDYLNFHSTEGMTQAEKYHITTLCFWSNSLVFVFFFSTLSYTELVDADEQRKPSRTKNGRSLAVVTKDLHMNSKIIQDQTAKTFHQPTAAHQMVKKRVQQTEKQNNFM